MIWLPWIVSLTVFGALALAGLAWSTQQEAARLAWRRRIHGSVRPGSLVQAPVVDELADAIGPIGDAVEVLLARSASRVGPGRFIVSLAVYAGAAMALGWGAFGPAGAVAGLATAAIPLWRLRQRAEARSRLLSRQLPDALDLIARSLRSGAPLTDALQAAAEETPAPLGDGLFPIAEKQRLGLSLTSGLRELRSLDPDNVELALFSVVVSMNRETGGNLIEALENLASTVRERLLFDERVLAMTSEVRASMRVLASLPFVAAGALLLSSPQYLMLLVSTDTGRVLLTVAGAQMVLAIFVMRRIARVEV